MFCSFLVFLLTGCTNESGGRERWDDLRRDMVEKQLIARDITDAHVLTAMRRVPRHHFVPVFERHRSYNDYPLEIGFRQTISQPYIVAYMTQAAQLKSTDRVLEIGTGSGYQAAVLAEIVQEVYSVEIVKELAQRATKTLADLNYANIHVRHGDGYQGWLEHAPYDAIIVTAAPQKIPEKLVEQLAVGGRMVIPIGEFYQELYVIRKTKEGIQKEPLLPVRFVPMVQE